MDAVIISEVFRGRAEDLSRALRDWPVQNLLSADADAVTDEFTRQCTMETHPISGEPWRDWINPAKHSDGYVVTIPIENAERAGRFFEYEPNPVQRIGGSEPRTRLTKEGLTFEVSGTEDADQIPRTLRANIEQRNKDVLAGNASLRDLIRPIMERVIADTRKHEAEAEARLNASNIPMRPASSDAPESGDGARHQQSLDDLRPMSSSTEAVTRVSSQAIRLKSIDVVIEVVREYVEDLGKIEEVDIRTLYSGMEFQLTALRHYVERGLSDDEAAQGIIGHLRHVWERLRPLGSAVDKTHKGYVIFMALGELLQKC